MKNKAILGYIMILLSAMCFGSYGIWSKNIGSEFGVFFQGWVRSALILLIIIPLTYLTNNFKSIDKKDRKWFFIAVAIGTFTQVPLYYAYIHMDLGTSNLIFFAMFVITSYLVGRFFLGEKITSIKLVSLLLAFIGLLLIFGFSLSKFTFLALFMAALNGVASGGEVSTTKKSSTKYSSLLITVYMWLAILITHLPLSLLFGERQVPLAFNTTWFSMVAFAVAGLAGFWLVIEGYKYVDASIGGLIGLSEIIFAVVFGMLFFGEKLTTTIFIGGAFVIFAAMLPDLTTLLLKRKS